ncbi:MAG: RNA methyltransferase [Candidatus Cloacimonadaceae bacterium]|nr:RNA methyltransferase [Candidatus Cloacimonadaceae bacterium]
MDIPELSKNRLKELVKLTQKKYREAEQKVVVEGNRAIEHLIGMGLKPLEIYASDAKALPDLNVPAYLLKQSDLDRLCDTQHPQKIAALYAFLTMRKFDFRVAFYLDGIGDPGNMGTIFRIASAFGIDGILLSPDCCEVMSPKTIRASLGAVFQIPWAIKSHDEIPSFYAALIYADMNGKTALQDYKLPRDKPLIIAVGSEAHGLSMEIKELAADSIYIPMKDGMESLNAAVATGIIAHHFWLQMRS